MPAAKAIVSHIEDMGTFINTGAGNANQIDMKVAAIVVGDDSTVLRLSGVQVLIDPTVGVGQINNAIHDAVAAAAAAQGYIIAPGRMLVPSFNKT